jgi:hypothetical protein
VVKRLNLFIERPSCGGVTSAEQTLQGDSRLRSILNR